MIRRRRPMAVAFVLASILPIVACSTGSDTPTSASTSSPSATSTTVATATTLIEITSPTWFSTRSGNISCVVEREYARCDISARAWQPPPKPAGCPLDWGPTLIVDTTQVGRFGCVSDSVFQPDVVVPYGRSVRNGSMSCAVEDVGVTCRSGAGHGFFLSMESYRLF